jgi:hypothetical protein
MKKVLMWAFIFTALTGSTYMTLTTATKSSVIEAYAKERYIPARQNYAVFDKITRERVHHRWYTHTKVTRQLEVCTVTKAFVDELKSERQVAYIGKTKYGSMFYKVKKPYQAELRAGISDRKCVTVKRPFWSIFIFNGGGTVS